MKETIAVFWQLCRQKRQKGTDRIKTKKNLVISFKKRKKEKVEKIFSVALLSVQCQKGQEGQKIDNKIKITENYLLYVCVM